MLWETSRRGTQIHCSQEAYEVSITISYTSLGLDDIVSSSSAAYELEKFASTIIRGDGLLSLVRGRDEAHEATDPTHVQQQGDCVIGLVLRENRARDAKSCWC